MNLDEAQKRKVTAWIEEGLKLSEIQSKLASELGVKLTYMETRFLVDDLKLTPKDHAPPQAAKEISGQPSGPGASAVGGDLPETEAPEAQPGTGAVSLSVDQV